MSQLRNYKELIALASKGLRKKADLGREFDKALIGADRWWGNLRSGVYNNTVDAIDNTTSTINSYVDDAKNAGNKLLREGDRALIGSNRFIDNSLMSVVGPTSAEVARRNATERERQKVLDTVRRLQGGDAGLSERSRLRGERDASNEAASMYSSENKRLGDLVSRLRGERDASNEAASMYSAESKRLGDLVSRLRDERNSSDEAASMYSAESKRLGDDVSRLRGERDASNEAASMYSAESGRLRGERDASNEAASMYSAESKRLGDLNTKLEGEKATAVNRGNMFRDVGVGAGIGGVGAAGLYNLIRGRKATGLGTLGYGLAGTAAGAGAGYLYNQNKDAIHGAIGSLFGKTASAQSPREAVKANVARRLLGAK